MGFLILFSLLGLSEPSTIQKVETENLMKTYYRNQEWSRFFAYAQFYRNRWKASEKSEVQLLEALALLRHCQNSTLEKLLVFLRKEMPLHRETLNQIAALSRTRFKGKKVSENKSEQSPLVAHFSGTAMTKISHERMNLEDPQNIRLKVENLCGPI